MAINQKIDEAFKAPALPLKIAGKSIEKGAFVPKADAQSEPELALPGTFTATGPFLLVELDLDAPFQTFNFLSPILHWVQPNLQASQGGATLVAGGTRPIADYIGPAPPPPSGPHRYVFLLYEQPQGLEVEKLALKPGQSAGLTKRIRFDLAAFEQKHKLGPVVAATYYTSN